MASRGVPLTQPAPTSGPGMTVRAPFSSHPRLLTHAHHASRRARVAGGYLIRWGERMYERTRRSPSLHPPGTPIPPPALTSRRMSTKRANSSDEKSPVETSEKSSVDGSRAGDEQPPALNYAASTKPKLPYSWQLVMIVLTCLCTCAYTFHFLAGRETEHPLFTVGNHWSNVSLMF